MDAVLGGCVVVGGATDGTTDVDGVGGGATDVGGGGVTLMSLLYLVVVL